MKLIDIIYEVQHLRDLLFPESAHALAGCSRALRDLSHSLTCMVHVNDFSDLAQLVNSKWPQLACIVVRNTVDQQGVPWVPSCKFEALAALKLTQLDDVSTALVVRSQQQQQQLRVTNEHRDIPAALALMCPAGQQNISALVLQDMKLGTDSIAQLAAVDWPDLTDLSVIVNTMDAVAVSLIAKAPWKTLQTLTLNTQNLDIDALEILTQSCWPSLKTLCVYTPCNTCIMPAATSWPHLTCLWLSGISLDPRSIRQLICVRLESLQLRNAGLGAAAMFQIVQHSWPVLQVLDISGNCLRADGLAVLFQTNCPCLRLLHLANNQLDCSAMKGLLNCGWDQLQFLVLSNNLPDDAAMIHLGKGPWSNLANLYLEGDTISATGLGALTAAKWPSLNELLVDRTAVCDPAQWALEHLPFEDRMQIRIGSVVLDTQLSCHCISGLVSHDTVHFCHVHAVGVEEANRHMYIAAVIVSCLLCG